MAPQVQIKSFWQNFNIQRKEKYWQQPKLPPCRNWPVHIHEVLTCCRICNFWHCRILVIQGIIQYTSKSAQPSQVLCAFFIGSWVQLFQTIKKYGNNFLTRHQYQREYTSETWLPNICSSVGVHIWSLASIRGSNYHPYRAHNWFLNSISNHIWSSLMIWFLESYNQYIVAVTQIIKRDCIHNA